jgi:hypothetical protein
VMATDQRSQPRMTTPAGLRKWTRRHCDLRRDPPALTNATACSRTTGRDADNGQTTPLGIREVSPRMAEGRAAGL